VADIVRKVPVLHVLHAPDAGAPGQFELGGTSCTAPSQEIVGAPGWV
jgi:hypothetical protein